jgi:hypothetical protein
VARRKVAILLTKAEILKGMDDTFGALALNPNPPLGFAGYLDPRFHNGQHIQAGKADQKEVLEVKHKLTETIESLHASPARNMVDMLPVDVLEKKEEDMALMYDSAIDQGFNSSLSAGDAVDKYLEGHCRTAAMGHPIVDPFEWFVDESNRKIYPHISSLARKWLAVPFVVESSNVSIPHGLEDFDLTDYIFLTKNMFN